MLWIPLQLFSYRQTSQMAPALAHVYGRHACHSHLSNASFFWSPSLVWLLTNLCAFAHLRRFPSAPEQQQELQELLQEPVSAAEPGLSRRSSFSSAGSKCCSRCGESIGIRYTMDGRFAQETRGGSVGSDDDVTMGDDDDTDDYVPKGGKGKGGRQPPGRGTKRSARQQQQQLPPLPPHGAGHKGSKRQRVASKKLQNSCQEQEEAGAEGHSKHTAQDEECAEGLMCSCCMRQIALQEVQQDCGTTLIVVPANILVQVRGSAHVGVCRCGCVQMGGMYLSVLQCVGKSMSCSTCWWLFSVMTPVCLTFGVCWWPAPEAGMHGCLSPVWVRIVPHLKWC
jgi:hypothetical protein